MWRQLTVSVSAERGSVSTLLFGEPVGLGRCSGPRTGRARWAPSPGVLPAFPWVDWRMGVPERCRVHRGRRRLVSVLAGSDLLRVCVVREQPASCVCWL